jgi:periplasmic protein TonB
MNREEKQNRNKALLASFVVQSILLLLIFMAIAWRAPNPPLPQYGIEINFGTDMAGSGAVQPETTPTTTEQDQSAEQQEETVEEAQPEAQQQEAKPTQTIPVETESPSKIESPVKAKTTVQEAKVTEPVKEKVNETVNKETEKKTTPTETKPVEKVKSDQTEAKDKESKVSSQGDNKEQVGDKGKEEGSLDAKAMYGQQGGGGGSSLELAGWEWDRLPKPQTPKNETGRIVFEIKVDDQGELISYKILERGVSIEAERACIAEIEKLSFVKKGVLVPPISTGKITFVFRSQ